VVTCLKRQLFLCLFIQVWLCYIHRGGLCGLVVKSILKHINIIWKWLMWMQALMPILSVMVSRHLLTQCKGCLSPVCLLYRFPDTFLPNVRGVPCLFVIYIVDRNSCNLPRWVLNSPFSIRTFSNFRFLQWWDSPKFSEMSSDLIKKKLLQVSLYLGLSLGSRAVTEQ